jgi:hypothetical protein
MEQIPCIEARRRMFEKTVARTPWKSPATLIRISSILYLGLALGHMSAYPWTSSHDPREIRLVDSMKSIPFQFIGERSSYWSLYFGWGLLVGVLLLTMAIVLWLLSGFVGSEPRKVGASSGLISASSLIGAYLSWRFFFVPPFMFYVAIFILLTAAAIRLLRSRDTATHVVGA